LPLVCEVIPLGKLSFDREIPLLNRTPEEWAELALRDPLALLNDHAYLEKKAASNALELLNRWPEPVCPDEWPCTLAAIASDEASHLSTVVRLLVKRGGRLERSHRNDYANRLRLHVRKGQGSDELVDRLLISALIELRSCARFEPLARYCRGRDSTLHRLYHRLGSSELGHYHVFLP
jgi:tRNA 2-(methylsulfanyl)-N6-isopentenyladenosine37 hydroxylase